MFPKIHQLELTFMNIVCLTLIPSMKLLTEIFLKNQSLQPWLRAQIPGKIHEKYLPG